MLQNNEDGLDNSICKLAVAPVTYLGYATKLGVCTSTRRAVPGEEVYGDIFAIGVAKRRGQVCVCVHGKFTHRQRPGTQSIANPAHTLWVCRAQARGARGALIPLPHHSAKHCHDLLPVNATKCHQGLN